MKTHQPRTRTSPAPRSAVLERMNANVAGIDCGATHHYVAVPVDRAPTPVQSFPTVTSVETTSDLKTAKVYVSVLGDEDAVTSTMQALREARPFIRREVGERTDLRFVPELEFVSDVSAARAARISKLLREANGDR